MSTRGKMGEARIIVAPESQATGRERPGRVLLVEDDAELRSMLQLTLESEGFVVSTASDGRQALQLAIEHRPSLVVLDFHLPIVEGNVFATALNLVYGRPVPIILITADRRVGELAARLNAAGYLHKPFDVDEFVRAVRRAMHLA